MYLHDKTSVVNLYGGREKDELLYIPHRLGYSMAYIHMNAGMQSTILKI
jgi:hypothetical protein